MEHARLLVLLIAGGVCLALSVVLWIRRKELEKSIGVAANIATILALVVALASLVLAVFEGSIPQKGDTLAPTDEPALSASPTATEAPTATPGAGSTSTPSEVPPDPTEPPPPSPTATPTGQVAAGEPSMPSGYVLFEGFEETGEPDSSDWRISGQLDRCSSVQASGYLSLACETPQGDVSLGLQPIEGRWLIAEGVALAAEVLTADELGSLDLDITLGDQAGPIRTYILQLSYRKVQVLEVNRVGGGWENEHAIGALDVEAGSLVIQAEYLEGALLFTIDGRAIEVVPDLPPGLAWQEWTLRGRVNGPVGRGPGMLRSHVFWAAVRQ